MFIFESNFILLAIGILLIVYYRYWWKKTKLKYKGASYLSTEFHTTHIFYWSLISMAFVKILINIFLRMADSPL